MHQWSATPCPAFLGFQLRSSEKRLTSLAIRGHSSVKCTPGIAVSMTLKGPRTPSEAKGLGSNVSWWLVPPWVQMKMQLTFERA